MALSFSYLDTIHTRDGTSCRPVSVCPSVTVTDGQTDTGRQLVPRLYTHSVARNWSFVCVNH